MLIGVLAAIGGLAVVFGLLDLTDFLLVRAGKRPMPRWRRIRDSRAYFRSAAIPGVNRGDPRRGRPARRRDADHRAGGGETRAPAGDTGALRAH